MTQLHKRFSGELVSSIKVELPSMEILFDKLHQSAPENTNLPNGQVRKE